MGLAMFGSFKPVVGDHAYVTPETGVIPIAIPFGF